MSEDFREDVPGSAAGQSPQPTHAGQLLLEARGSPLPTPVRLQGPPSPSVELKERSLDEKGIDRLVLFQAIIRGRQTRSEMARAKADAGIALPRQLLLDRLREYPDARTSKGYLFCYLIYMALVLSLFLSGLTFEEEYARHGKIRHLIVENSAIKAYNVQTQADFWKLIQDGILASTDSTPIFAGESVYRGGIGFQTQFSDDIISIAQGRFKRTDCASIYEIDGSVWDYPDHGRCRIAEEDTEAYQEGTNTYGLTAHQVMYLFYSSESYAGQATIVDKYIGSSATDCPSFTYTKRTDTGGLFQLSHKDGAYIVAFNVSSPRATQDNHKLAISMLQRCNFIDTSSSMLAIEFYLITGNISPVFSTLRLAYELDLHGNIDYSESFISIDITKHSQRTKNYKAFSIMMLAVSIIALMWLLLDCVYNIFMRLGSVEKIFRYIQESQVLLGASNYVSAIVASRMVAVVLDKRLVLIDQPTFYEYSYYNAYTAVEIAIANERTFQAINLFLLFIRFLGYSRYRGLLSLLWKVAATVAIPTMHFLISLSIITLGFATAACKKWGAFIENYSTFIKTYWTLTNQLAGSFDFYETQRVSPVFAPLFFLAYFLFVGSICMNFLVAIILEGYTVVSTQGNVMNVTIWAEGLGDARQAMEILRDCIARPKSTSTSHLAFLLQVDSKRQALRTRRDVTLWQLRRLVYYDLTAEAKDALYFAMKDSGIEDPEQLKQAYAGSYWHLRTDYVQDHYGSMSRRLLWMTPMIFRRYVLMAMHGIAHTRAMLARKRSTRSYRSSMRKTLRGINDRKIHPKEDGMTAEDKSYEQDPSSPSDSQGQISV